MQMQRNTHNLFLVLELETALEKTQMSQIRMSEIINNPVLLRYTQGPTLTHAMLFMLF